MKNSMLILEEQITYKPGYTDLLEELKSLIINNRSLKFKGLLK